MTRLLDRLAKLEASAGARRPARRVLNHILDCAPEDREAQIAAIKAEDPEAFHIVNVIIDPSENGIRT